MEAALSSKGQVTTPKAVRERLHLKPVDRFKILLPPGWRDHLAENADVTVEGDHFETSQTSVPPLLPIQSAAATELIFKAKLRN